MAQLIQVNGDVSTHLPANPPEWSLKELQFLVGGYIELVKIRAGSSVEGAVAFCDEDGRCKGLKLNETASAVVGFEYRGPVLILGDDERS
jgi:hypothetical protein